MDDSPHTQKAGKSSLHEYILGHLRARIVSGDLPPGARIPSEMELAETFRCSRMTVNKALTQLAAAGLIERRRKAGSFVAKARARSAILDIPDIPTAVAALGLAYRFEITARKVRPLADDEQPQLDMAEAAPVLALTTLHYGGAEPFCLEDRLINLAEVPDAAQEAFKAVPPGSWLVAKVPFTDGEHRIRAEAAGERAARLLGIPRGAACLVMERRTWRAGAPITWVRLAYPGDKQEMIARFQPG